MWRLSTRRLLVMGQVALSVVLLIGAGLLLRSFVRLQQVDLGFRPASMLTAKIALPTARYDTAGKRAAFFRAVESRVGQLPGVRSAAIAMSLPTTSSMRTNIVEVEGRPMRETVDEVGPFGILQSVTPGYFRTLSIPLRRGREFTARDGQPGAKPVMMVNESMARVLWPGYPDRENPIGQHVTEGFDKAAGRMEVVGVAADIREAGLTSGAEPEFYVPSCRASGADSLPGGAGAKQSR